MIVKMTRYDFVLLSKQHEDFLNRLQDLGLVDITSAGWEPDDRERGMLVELERHQAARQRLEELRKQSGFVPGEPYATGREAWTAYLEATSRLDTIASELDSAEKDLQSLRIWGNYPTHDLEALRERGLVVRFFSVYANEYKERIAQWNERYLIEPINRVGGVVYFVVIAYADEDVILDAQEVKVPAATTQEIETRIAALHDEAVKWEKVLARCAASVDLIEVHAARLEEDLQFSRAVRSGKEAAENSLIVMEGWSEQDKTAQVEAMLNEYPGVVYLRSQPTPEDETPVKLKNNAFARPFEVIGDFYALPRYGTMDLTPYFAPFYMIFFGFCLAEAGYGLILLLAGLFMLWKGGVKMKRIAWLTILCSVSTIVFGLLTGSFFGIQLADWQVFASFRGRFLTSDRLFSLAIGLGIVQVLFGMVLKIVTRIKAFGWKYVFPNIGWLAILLATILALYGKELGLSFSMESIVYYVVVAAGLFMMLFLNTPGKNPFINLGNGLWNTYNDVSGIIGDVLSYIRLFAIGLSSGILAMVFNDLAFGLSPHIPVVRELVIVLILLIGHGINLFMSTLSSFVHPMRLTFVEFYKNAGFEPSVRAFSPLKRHARKQETE